MENVYLDDQRYDFPLVLAEEVLGVDAEPFVLLLVLGRAFFKAPASDEARGAA